MQNFPDLTPVIYFAAFGVACALVGGMSFLIWAVYHVVSALILYIGA